MTNLQWDKSALLQEDVNTATNEIKIQILELEKPEIFNELPILDGNSITHALRIADTIQDELHKIFIFRNKKVIQNKINELNRHNTYSFIGYMITTSNSQTALGDFKDYLSYECLKHLLICFLKQAEDFGFGETSHFRTLKREYHAVIKTGGSSLKRKVNKKIFEEANNCIENLYMEMTKYLR